MHFSALSDSYTILMLSRVLTALVSGVLNALALSIANDTMPAAKRSSVIAFIFAGFSIANVFGLPLGTLVGQLGSWHLTFWLTALLGVIAFITNMFAIPKNTSREKSSLKAQLGLLTHYKIIVAFLIPVFSVAGTYIIYTYITPIIEEGLSIPASYVSIVLLIYGVFSIFSNMLSGKIASQNGMSKLRYAFIIQAIILTSLYFTINSTWAGIFSLMLMGVMMYVMNATIQLYLMDLAGRVSPGTKDFAASLTPVAFNIGIALGSFVGGYVVAIGNLKDLAWVGGISVLIAAGLASISYSSSKKESYDSEEEAQYSYSNQ